VFKKAWGVCQITLAKSLWHPRVILIFTLLMIYLDYSLSGVGDFCSAYDVKVSLGELLVQMFDNRNIQGCLLLLYVFLITDLPGSDRNEQYILMRSGVWPWLTGKMLCVMLLAAIWMFAISVGICLVVESVDLSASWSRAIITLAKTDARNIYSIRMLFSAKMIGSYDLAHAIRIEVCLNYALAVIGGLWVLLLNYATGRPVGCFVLSLATLLSMSIGGLLNTGIVYRFSPVSMAQLDVIDGGIDAVYPSIDYVISFYAGLFMLGAIGLCVLTQVKKDYSHVKM